MTNYAQTPDAHPWSRDLDAGDRLTGVQNYLLCHTRLRDFGLETRCLTPKETDRSRERWVVRAIRA